MSMLQCTLDGVPKLVSVVHCSAFADPETQAEVCIVQTRVCIANLLPAASLEKQQQDRQQHHVLQADTTHASLQYGLLLGLLTTRCF